MTTFRSTAALLFFAASMPVLATPAPLAPTPSCTEQVQAALYALDLAADAFGDRGNGLFSDASPPAGAAPGSADRDVDRRELLAAFALTLRDIRYRAGGRAPKTGFDCSGFVQYVYAHSLGFDLPDNSASQFRDGARVARGELRTGDLVFFHTRGKHVSHVGIYLDNGRFIHAPSTGKHVRVDDLHDAYWAHRYAGAKRPTVLT
jgi:cell wall-associated NlpC family hydrolase